MLRNVITAVQVVLSFVLAVAVLYQRTTVAERHPPTEPTQAGNYSFAETCRPVLDSVKEPASTSPTPQVLGIEETDSGSLIFGVGLNPNLLAPPKPKQLLSFWAGSFFH